jgi:hypothetical protein
MNTSYDFAERIFVDREEYAIALQDAQQQIVSFAESVPIYMEALKNPEIRSIVRIGDTEGVYACLTLDLTALQRQNALTRFWFSGIDSSAPPDCQEFLQILDKVDLLMAHHPDTAGGEQLWGATYLALKHNGFFERKKIIDIHPVYAACYSGQLFRELSGKKVALVGGKAKLFKKYFFDNQQYNSLCPFLGLQDIASLHCIETPDLPVFAMSKRSEIVQKVRDSFSLGIDCYLLCCGLLSDYLAVLVQEEAGAFGWDIGNGIEILMGLKQDRGSLCGPFLNFEHPEYELIVDDCYMNVIEVRKRVNPLSLNQLREVMGVE